MTVIGRIFDACAEGAAGATVGSVTAGLGYTAVTTADGRLGLCYTMTDRRACCTQARHYRDFEGGPATDLLEYVRSDDGLERSMGVALANALNEPRAAAMPEDTGPRAGVIGRFGVGAGTKVAMVGYFGPVIAGLQRAGAEVSVLDRDREMGDEAAFLDALASWPDVVVLTATSLLDDSFERFAERVHGAARVVVMGPSTPMFPEAFEGLPVHLLAGMVAVAKERILAVVRQGGGTPAIAPHAKKVAVLLGDPEGAGAPA